MRNGGPWLGSSHSTSLANKSAKFRFHGVSAHAAGAPERGRSALDGVEGTFVPPTMVEIGSIRELSREVIYGAPPGVGGSSGTPQGRFIFLDPRGDVDGDGEAQPRGTTRDDGVPSVEIEPVHSVIPPSAA